MKNLPFSTSDLKQADSQDYTALTWFTDQPSSEDELYKILLEVEKAVKNAMVEIQEHQVPIEKKGQGMSTQYLMAVPDHVLPSFTID